MPTVLKRNAVIVLGLAALFYWYFMFAKHDPALRNVIPFGEDPYDAVGSFAVIVGVLVALLSLVRAFRQCRESPSSVQKKYLVRSQQTVVLVVCITLATDAIAMARHWSMWIGSPSQDRLVAIFSVLVIATAAVQMLIKAARKNIVESGRAHWGKPIAGSLAAIVVLALYPEELIRRTDTHLLTVVLGNVLLFAPTRLLLSAIAPYTSDEMPKEKSTARGGVRWAVALLAGIMIGTFAFLSEMGEGSLVLPRGRAALVASVFISLGVAGILLAYAFLGKPLGLRPRG